MHGALDGTHLAGELRATHPGEAHDGGSRGVEGEGGVEDLGRFSMPQVNDGSRDPDKLVLSCADWRAGAEMASARTVGSRRFRLSTIDFWMRLPQMLGM